MGAKRVILARELSLEEVAALRRSQHVFLPQRPQAACEAQYRLWRRAVDRALRWIENDV